MAHFVFYCNDERARIKDTEYYQQDIEALERLGHDITVCTAYREIPGSFDAMFVWWWTYALWPVLLARAKNKPSIVTGVFNFRFPETFDGTDYFKRPPWQRFLIRKAVRACSMNLFIDATELRECTSYFKLHNGRHYPCVVADDYLLGPLPDRRTVLFNLAWSGKQNLIRKGIPELLQAVRLLKDEGIRTAVQLAGHPGDGHTFLTETIARLGLNDSVTHLGALDRASKIELLRTCELYVQPSHYEGFGLAVAEAMGCGSCIIACDVGAVRSVVGDAAIYVRPGDPADLARAIERALNDLELRRSLQDAATSRARTMFRAEAKTTALAATLADLGIQSPALQR